MVMYLQTDIWVLSCYCDWRKSVKMTQICPDPPIQMWNFTLFFRLRTFLSWWFFVKECRFWWGTAWFKTIVWVNTHLLLRTKLIFARRTWFCSWSFGGSRWRCWVGCFWIWRFHCASFRSKCWDVDCKFKGGMVEGWSVLFVFKVIFITTLYYWIWTNTVDRRTAFIWDKCSIC